MCRQWTEVKSVYTVEQLCSIMTRKGFKGYYKQIHEDISLVYVQEKKPTWNGAAQMSRIQMTTRNINTGLFYCFILNSTVDSIFKVEYCGYKPALYLNVHIGIWISKLGFCFKLCCTIFAPIISVSYLSFRELLQCTHHSNCMYKRPITYLAGFLKVHLH